MFWRFARKRLWNVLSKPDIPRLQIPTKEETIVFQYVINKRFLMIVEVYAVGDDLQVTFQQSCDSTIQKMF